jgi:hypothetical protein
VRRSKRYPCFTCPFEQRKQGVHCDAEDYYTQPKDATKNREKPTLSLGNIQKTINRKLRVVTARVSHFTRCMSAPGRSVCEQRNSSRNLIDAPFDAVREFNR